MKLHYLSLREHDIDATKYMRLNDTVKSFDVFESQDYYKTKKLYNMLNDEAERKNVVLGVTLEKENRAK